MSEKAEPSSTRLALTLGAAGLLSGLGLVGMYEATLPTIQRNKAEALRKAVFEVVPGASRMQPIEGDTYAAFDGDTFKGYAVAAEGPGFQDTIRLIFGVAPARDKIIGMRVLESRETPGLGDKIFKDKKFVDAWNDLAVKPEIVAVKGGASKPHELDSITGATISSKAVVKIVNKANEAWLEKLPPPERLPKAEQKGAAAPIATEGHDG